MATYGIWIIAGVIALIIDLLSGTLFMLWVGGGCFVAALLSALLPGVVWAPWAAFVVATALLLYLGRPLASTSTRRRGSASSGSRARPLSSRNGPAAVPTGRGFA